MPDSLTFSIGYTYESSELEPDNKNQKNFIADLGKTQLDDDYWKDTTIKQHGVYIESGFSFWGDWEIYARAGAANAQVESFGKLRDKDASTGEDYDISDIENDIKPYGTAGFRGVLLGNKYISIGPFAQLTVYSNYSDEHTIDYKITGTGGAPSITSTASITRRYRNPWNASAGLSARALLVETDVGSGYIYGGGFYYLSRAQARTNLNLDEVFPKVRLNYSTELKENGNWGGFAGFSFVLSGGTTLNVEVQLKSKPSFGVSLSKGFF